MKTADKSKKWGKALPLLKEVALIAIASISIAAGLELFLAPAAINAGGFMGIAQILAIWMPDYIYLGALYVIVNIPVMVLAMFFFSKKFVATSSMVVIATGGIMLLLQMLDISARFEIVSAANLTLISIVGGALIAIGIAVVITGESSAGGTDIIALIVQKKYRISNVSRLFIIFDLVVIAAYSLIVDSFSSFLYSVAALFAYQITLELVFGSFGNAIMFEIVSEDSAPIIKAVNEELDRGSTMFKAVGTYTKNTKEVVVCVVRKRQEAKARELVKRVSPESFAYTIPIKEVMGKGFRNINF